MVACEETRVPSLLYYIASVDLLVMIQTCTDLSKKGPKYQDCNCRYCYWADSPQFFTDHNFSTEHDKICYVVKYLIFPWKITLSVFSVQGHLHLNKITSEILKKAFP